MKPTRLLAANLTVLLTLPIFCLAAGTQQEQKSESESAQLLEARRANEEAQAEYYREQLKVLRRGAPQKTFWQNIADNPASIMGVVAAVIVALVTLTSFLMNYRVSLNNQQDTQFYEALKRFGDKDSPALRSSAAGILGHMAGVRRRKFSWNQPIRSLKTGEPVYFITTRNQLITGLLLEENQVALLSIRDALHILVTFEPDRALEMVFRANQNLYRKAISALAKFFVACGVEDRAQITEEQVTEAAFLSLQEKDTLHHIMQGEEESLQNALRSQLQAYQAIPQDKKGDQLIDARTVLSTTLFRLRLVVHVYALAFTRNRLSNFTKEYGPLFLAGGDLRGADLRDCRLVNGNLWRANLSGANLMNADLSGTALGKAQLLGTRLAGAQISTDTILDDANWWEADFYTDDNKSTDIELLSELSRRYQTDVPDNVTSLHESVRAFLADQTNSGSQLSPVQKS